MWVRDIDGDLVNLTKCILIQIVEGDDNDFEVVAEEPGDDGTQSTLYAGPELEAKNYLDRLATRLGVQRV